ncbi:hypothetical protein KIW84_064170 [Lathyrus oleraceus]|uniref:Uncharacterized protein n=1 Tax=Pisum sativum TaxID=3888 RepID=A0A9D5AAQ0_PEA|nr:hypothetical protein KIW84_064170 [Pisum sativum]
MVDEEGTKGLQESDKLSQLRPTPPRRSYRTSHLVMKLTFITMKDVYSQEELRRHHKWVDGSSIPPFSQQDYDSEIKESERVTAAETVSGDKGDFKFKPGTLVEGTSGMD